MRGIVIYREIINGCKGRLKQEPVYFSENVSLPDTGAIEREALAGVAPFCSPGSEVSIKSVRLGASLIVLQPSGQTAAGDEA